MQSCAQSARRRFGLVTGFLVLLATSPACGRVGIGLLPLRLSDGSGGSADAGPTQTLPDGGMQSVPDGGMQSVSDGGMQSVPDSGMPDSGPPACPTVCENAHGSADCSSGICVATCATGYQDCDGDPTNGCETSTTDTTTSCGGCNMSCDNPHGSAMCSQSMCMAACATGYGDCDGNAANGCETALTSVSDCGACGATCANPHGSAACSQGLCTPTCATDYGDCDGDAANGCETALTSVSDCGACGATCANAHGTTSCNAGACVPSCAPGFADCDGDPSNGCETDTDADPQHCGSCGGTCNTTTQFCMGGSCQLSACSAGFGECDGNLNTSCETNLTNDVSNCGFCGNVCMEQNASAQCVSSACAVGTCNSGYADCNGQASDGCEITLATSTANCGSCGTACSNAHGTTSCVSSSCAPSCSSGYGDCDTSRQNGCETALNTVSNCGMCGKTCPAMGGTPGCSAGVCTVSCSVTGSWALKSTAPATWPSTSVLKSGSGDFVFWARLDVTESGNNFSGSLTPCGQTVPDFRNVQNELYGTTYPNTIYDNNTLPSTATSGSLASTAPGSSFSLATTAYVQGVSLSNPVTDAWPSRTSLVQVDVDNDGHPAVTAPYKNSSGYSYIPTDIFASSRAKIGYLAMRSVFALSGTLTSCTQASGTWTPQNGFGLNYHTLGCQLTSGGSCNSTQTNYLDSNGPTFTTSNGSFTLVKVANGASCATVRAAVP